jgi:hypothetical protein
MFINDVGKENIRNGENYPRDVATPPLFENLTSADLMGWDQ